MEYLVRGTLWVLILVGAFFVSKSNKIMEVIHVQGSYGRSG